MAARNTTRRIAAAAAKPTTTVVGGYTRLSVDRNGDKIGYEVQRKAIEKYADTYGWQVRWYEDADITAADKDVVRPEYERMLTDLADGVISGIVVWRLDRLVRLTREFERCYGIVEDAGGFIVDVQQQFSTQSDMGKFVMRLLVMLADMEIAGMKTRQRAHQRLKAEKGRFHGGGRRPFGFVGAEYRTVTVETADGPKEKRKIINSGEFGIAHHPVEAKLLRDAARRIAYEGVGYADVLREWAQMDPPITGTNGYALETSALVDILTRPRTAGLRAVEDVNEATGEVTTTLHRAEWEPIVDRETWERLRGMRTVRSVPTARRADYLLTGGVVVCGNCGKRMIGSARTKRSDKSVRVLAYQCEGTLGAKQRGHCGRVNITAEATDEVTLEALFARLERKPELFDVVNQQDNANAAAELSEALSELSECDAELERLAELRALPSTHPDRLDEVEWSTLRVGYRRRKAEATATVERVGKRMATPVPMGKDRDDIRGWFDDLTHGQRCAFVRRFVRSVVIAPSRRGGNRMGGADLSRITPLFAEAEHLRGVGQ
jgi:DNA invertase Pin-like site-specific DNA recombinase